jgi:hypothetical protein
LGVDALREGRRLSEKLMHDAASSRRAKPVRGAAESPHGRGDPSPGGAAESPPGAGERPPS